jgi:hypothetical protein
MNEIEKYSDAELFSLFDIDYRQSKSNPIQTLRKIDDFMKSFLQSTKNTQMKTFMEDAGKRILYSYILLLEDSELNVLFSIFSITESVYNAYDAKQKATQMIQQEEGFVKLYLENAMNIMIHKVKSILTSSNNTSDVKSIEQFMYLDTRFRKNLNLPANGTVFDLPDLKLTHFIGLHHIEIPLSWKVFDHEKQNNYFFIGVRTKLDLCGYNYDIPNYIDSTKYIKIEFNDIDFWDATTNDSMLNVITEKINKNTKHQFSSYFLDCRNEYNKIQFNIIVRLIDSTSHATHFDTRNSSIHIVFHDPKSTEFSKVNRNHTLGWKLGFRVADIYLDSGNNIATATTFYSFTKNTLFLQLDDFTNGSTESPIILPDIPNTVNTENNIFSKYIISQVDQLTSQSVEKQIQHVIDTNNNDHLKNNLYNQVHNVKRNTDLSEITNQSTQIIMDNIHNSLYNRNIHDHSYIQEPFGIISVEQSPLKSLQNGQVITENSNELEFRKVYTEPVTLSKLKITIVDEQGIPVDFQGEDFRLQLKIKKRTHTNSVSMKV